MEAVAYYSRLISCITNQAAVVSTLLSGVSRPIVALTPPTISPFLTTIPDLILRTCLAPSAISSPLLRPVLEKDTQDFRWLSLKMANAVHAQGREAWLTEHLIVENEELDG